MYRLGKLKMAKNSSDLTNSLFNPGGTCDGYIVDKLATTIRVKIFNEFYAIRNDGLFMKWNGKKIKPWYSYTLDSDVLGVTYSEQLDACKLFYKKVS